MVLDDVLAACVKYLAGASAFDNTSPDDRSFLRTFVACQLQEVDWCLNVHCKSIAACETLVMIKRVGEGVVPADLSISGERNAVRTILVFRAILIAVMFQGALDYSEFVDSGTGTPGAEVVLLR